MGLGEPGALVNRADGTVWMFDDVFEDGCFSGLECDVSGRGGCLRQLD
jgi:hypothetical protein